jgi:hypothetical protein
MTTIIFRLIYNLNHNHSFHQPSRLAKQCCSWALLPNESIDHPRSQISHLGWNRPLYLYAYLLYQCWEELHPSHHCQYPYKSASVCAPFNRNCAVDSSLLAPGSQVGDFKARSVLFSLQDLSDIQLESRDAALLLGSGPATADDACRDMAVGEIFQM